MAGVGLDQELYRGLDEAQMRAVKAPEAPLVIIAGAGSGKTTTLVRRIGHMVASGWVLPSEILAVSHTTKAANEVSERLKGFDESLAGVSCHTVHAAAWRIVRQFGGGSPEILTSIYPLVRDALGKSDTSLITDVVAEIEWARSRCLTPAEYATAHKKQNRTCPVTVPEFQRVWELYNAKKRDRNILDFADVLEEAARLLVDPEVAKRVLSKWRAVVVDEFQDTDLLQYRFLSMIRGGRPLWTVVGDPRQTIYSFKGADASLLEEARREPGCLVVELDTSYRCGNGVLEAANKLVGPRYGSPLKAVHQCAPPELIICDDDEDEASQVALRLADMKRRGTAYEEMAVLYRYNASGAAFEAALAELSIPYQVAGGVKFFDRPEIRAVLVPFGQAARQNPSGDAMAMLNKAAARTGWNREEPPAGAGAVRGRWESILALCELAERQQATSAEALLERLLSVAKTGGGIGVTLGTVHAAKGLEWDAVIVAGCVEGQLPSAYAKTATELEEERRLMYVAVTRARRELVLTFPQRRFKRPADPSRFLGEMGLKAVGVRRTRSTQKAPKSAPSVPAHIEALLSCSTCSGRLAGLAARTMKICSSRCLQGAEKQRYAALEAWRREQAAVNMEEPEDLVSDRALFMYLATGRTGSGWRPNVKPPTGI